MPRVANVLLVHHATIKGPSCFSLAKVRLFTLGFVVVIQIKVCLCYVVIVLLFSKYKIYLILVSFLTVS
jgi:hypothetical protein